MNKRTKALSISPKVKEKVRARDGGVCVLCGRMGDPVCHFISRAQGGLGIPENVWTGCVECHRAYDQSANRPFIAKRLEAFFKSKYPNWDKSKLIYKKE